MEKLKLKELHFTMNRRSIMQVNVTSKILILKKRGRHCWVFTAPPSIWYVDIKLQK